MDDHFIVQPMSSMRREKAAGRVVCGRVEEWLGGVQCRVVGRCESILEEVTFPEMNGINSSYCDSSRNSNRGLHVFVASVRSTLYLLKQVR